MEVPYMGPRMPSGNSLHAQDSDGRRDGEFRKPMRILGRQSVTASWVLTQCKTVTIRRVELTPVVRIA